MALRLIEMVIPEAMVSELEGVMKGEVVEDIWIQSMLGLWQYPSVGVWEKRFLEKLVLVRILIQAENTERLMDILGSRFSGAEGFRISLLPVVATLPVHVVAPSPHLDAVLTQDGVAEEPKGDESNNERISRYELYDRLEGSARTTRVYLTMVALSSIVAAIGMLGNNVAVIVGAMVIAPLLGPNIALALATTLGDMDLAKKAFRASLEGIFVAVALSVSIGIVFEVDPGIPQISSRTEVGIVEVVLALASGCAGALAVATGVSEALVGVAVAVSLVPPLVAFGMLLGDGQTALAWGALLLFLSNLVSINLAGVATFLAQGIRPASWWEAERARKATGIAIALWIVLLVILVGAIIASQRVP